MEDKPLSAGQPAPPHPETGTTIHAEVWAEVERRRTSSQSWVKNLLFLGVTLAIFYQLGLLTTGPRDLAVIVGVLLLHETGHFVGMRLFGYRNVKMFFIPLFGAAVSGRGHDVPGHRRALVSLMGPLPGILLGLVFAVVAVSTSNQSMAVVPGMLLLLNGFNLLPLMPLDGGWLLQEVIFSRHRYLEVAFTLLAAAALLGGALLLRDWVLGVLGALVLFSVPHLAKVASIAHSCRSLAARPAPDGDSRPADDELPLELGTHIINKVMDAMPALKKPKAIASATEQVWERLCRRPPGTLASISLLAVYIVSLSLSLIGAMVLYAAFSGPM
jgi:Zn-dependent protease